MKNVTVLQEGQAEIEAALDLPTLEAIRVKYLGKKGLLTELLKGLGSLPPDERPQAGQAINEAKTAFLNSLLTRRQSLEEKALADSLLREKLDVTLPGRAPKIGGLHPITKARMRIENLFQDMGF